MKKKLFTTLLVAVILVMSLSSIAMARGNEGAYANYNSNIEMMTGNKGHAGSIEMKTLIRMVDQANKRVEALVKNAQATPWNDIAWMQFKIKLVITPVFIYADIIGAKVVCEYVEYYIDGQYVMVDPLRVVNV
ncbi:MAG: hypothetical protein RR232_03845 [Clostridia bacterium]